MQTSELQRQRATLATTAFIMGFVLLIIGNMSWNNPVRQTDYGHTNLTVSAYIAWSIATVVLLIGLLATAGYQRQKAHFKRKHGVLRPITIEWCQPKQL